MVGSRVACARSSAQTDRATVSKRLAGGSIPSGRSIAFEPREGLTAVAGSYLSGFVCFRSDDRRLTDVGKHDGPANANHSFREAEGATSASLLPQSVWTVRGDARIAYTAYAAVDSVWSSGPDL